MVAVKADLPVADTAAVTDPTTVTADHPVADIKATAEIAVGNALPGAGPMAVAMAAVDLTTAAVSALQADTVAVAEAKAAVTKAVVVVTVVEAGHPDPMAAATKAVAGAIVAVRAADTKGADLPDPAVEADTVVEAEALVVEMTSETVAIKAHRADQIAEDGIDQLRGANASLLHLPSRE